MCTVASKEKRRPAVGKNPTVRRLCLRCQNLKWKSTCFCISNFYMRIVTLFEKDVNDFFKIVRKMREIYCFFHISPKKWKKRYKT